MSDPLSFRLVHPAARRNALAAVSAAPEGWEIIVQEWDESRNNDQNALLHAALTDIARQVTWHGQKFKVLTWKRLCMASWLREEGHQPELIPALDGNGFDVIFEHTSRLGKKRFASLVDWVMAFGTQHGVVFRDNRHAAA